MRRLLLAFVLPAALVACDSKKPVPPPPAKPTTTPDGPEAPAADAKPYASRDKTNDGVIAGRVVFKGAVTLPPPPQPTSECQGHSLASELIVHDAEGGLQNVFVYIRRGDITKWTFDVPSEPIMIDQRGCRYYPHVQGMVQGQNMRIKNSDAFMHNVHSMADRNPVWSIGQTNVGEEILTLTSKYKTFDQREVMAFLKCDIHGWMGCWIGVLPHTLFAVSGPDGTFRIDGVPPGEYTVEAWHEFLGNKAALPKATSPIQRTVKVEAGGAVTLDLEFKM